MGRTPINAMKVNDFKGQKAETPMPPPQKKEAKKKAMSPMSAKDREQGHSSGWF